MTAQDDPYVRVYYSIVDDPKFADVYDDDAALATWLRLLLHADAMYPAAATLPRGTRKVSVDKLVKVGLVDMGAGYRYRVRGLAAEREKRAEAARFAADVKHHGLAAAMQRQSERRANAVRAQSERSADGVPLRTEPLRTEPNRATPTRAPALENGALALTNGEVEIAALRQRLATVTDPALREGMETTIAKREALSRAH